MDSKTILAQISYYYSNGLVKRESYQMKMILDCAGLSDLYTKNEKFFEPYYQYNGHQYGSRTYNIYEGLISVFESLLKANSNEKIIELLKWLGNEIPPIILFDEDRPQAKYFIQLVKLYQLYGLDIEVDENDNYLRPNVKEVSPQKDITKMSLLERWLKEKYPECYKSYKAISDAYEDGNLGTAVESCRTILTGLFSQFKGIPFKEAKWSLGLARETGDFSGTKSEDRSQMTPIKSELDLMSKKDISDFFGDSLNGKYTKTKAIYSVYSMLSDYGTHSQEGTPEKLNVEDALMMINMTRDILMWVYMRHEND